MTDHVWGLHVPCFECDAPAAVQHHVVPRARGGTKTVPLCAGCYRRLQGSPCPEHHSLLIREGRARARAAGKRLGRPPVISRRRLAQIRHALAGGMSKGEVCRRYRVARSTLYDSLARSRATGATPAHSRRP